MGVYIQIWHLGMDVHPFGPWEQERNHRQANLFIWREKISMIDKANESQNHVAIIVR